MNKIKIIKLKGVSSPQAIKEEIIGQLKRRNLYRSDLMYRGFSVDKEGYQNFLKYGTDRAPSTSMAHAFEDYCSIEEKIINMSDEEFEEHLPLFGLHPSIMSREEFDKSLEECSSECIWALPEQGLVNCIETYSLKPNSNTIPIISAYKPEYLIHDFHPALSLYGKPANEIPLKYLLDEGFAKYKFKNGISAREAILIAFRINNKNIESDENYNYLFQKHVRSLEQ